LTATRWKAPVLLCAALSPFLLAGCSQTTSHGMSVASLADSITPSVFKARSYRYTSRDKECMARVMYFESNRSSRDGMVAVGTVVMNRLRSGKHGSAICEVVGEPGQFAPGVMTRKMDSRGSDLARDTAEAVLKGERSPKLKNAMYFHTAGLKFPYKNMHYVLVAGGNSFYEKRTRNWQPLPPETMVAYSGPAPDVDAAKPAVMVASAEPATTADALPGVAQADLPDTVSVASVTPERPAKGSTAKTVAAAKPMPLPENSPFAVASADPQMDQGFDAAAPKPVQKPAVQKKRARVAAPAVDIEVAFADPPAKPSRKPVIDPESAPLPTARASMFGTASAKPAKRVKPQAVEVAAEEPLAARFGRADDEPAVSMGFAQ
jgi:spore germination cell wall hydrolase CwlJ-like protein